MELTKPLSIDQLAVTEPPVLPLRRSVWPSVVVVGVYLFLGVVAYWPVFPGISGRAFSIDGDFIQSVWFIGWVPHALAHGLNPFFSNAMFVPTGVNLAQNTASPFLGLLTAPFALALSPLVIANLLMALGMPVSAIAAYVVLRTWKVWWPAAALGGLIYGFSPYMVGQGMGHPELIFVPLPPFIALTVALILQGQGPRRRLGFQLGLLLIAQYLISPEVLAVVVVLIVVAVACVALRKLSAFPTLAQRAVRPVVIACVMSAIALAYPLWMLLAGPQRFVGTAWPLINPFHNDLLSFVAPGPLQRISLGVPSNLGGAIVGDPTEAGGYIGVPLLVLVGFLAWRSRKSPRMQLAVVLLISSAILSLGPYLSVRGQATHFPLPFLLLGHVPMLGSILPSRISLAVDAFLAAVIAFGVDDLRWAGLRRAASGEPGRRRIHRRRATGFAALILVLVVVTQLPRWPYATQAAVGLPATVRSAIPGGDPVAVTYPYTFFPYVQPMLWQAQAEFAFRTTGGYAYHASTPVPTSDQEPPQWFTANGSGSAGSNPMSPPQMQSFLLRQEISPTNVDSATISPELVATTRIALSNYDVRLVIVDRQAIGSKPVLALFTDALGPPSLSQGSYSVWTDWHGALGR